MFASIDFKWYKFLLFISVIVWLVGILWYFGLRSLQYGIDLQNTVQDGVVNTLAMNVNVTSAPMVLKNLTAKKIGDRNIDQNETLYIFNESFEDLSFNKKIKSSELIAEFNTNDVKSILITSHPTEISGKSGFIKLFADGSAKLGNETFTQRQMSYQNNRLLGTLVSGVGFGAFSSEEADRLIKTSFPNAHKVLIKDNKYMIVSEALGDGIYGKKANITLVDPQSVPSDPIHSNNDIYAVIPWTTVANGNTFKVLERVGDVIYQKDGAVKVMGGMETPTANINGKLILTVIEQNKIKSILEWNLIVICKDPENYVQSGQDCIKVPKTQTDSGKDKVIEKQKEIIKTLQKDSDKLNEYKDNWFVFFTCLDDYINSYQSDSYRRTYRTSNFSFLNNPDCYWLKTFHWDARWHSSGYNQYRHWWNEIKFEFFENKNTWNPYMNDLISCESIWGYTYVCLFKWNNPFKVKELFLTTKTQTTNWTTTCNHSKSRLRCTCSWAWGNRGTWYHYGWVWIVPNNPRDDNFLGLWWNPWTNTVSSRDDTVTFSTTKNFFRNTKKLFNDIINYLNTLTNDNVLWNQSITTTYNVLGIIFEDSKSINWFSTNACITKIGCYWTWANSGYILLDWQIHKIVQPSEAPAGMRQSCYGDAAKAIDWKYRYGILYQTFYDRQYEKETTNPLEFKNLLLYR